MDVSTDILAETGFLDIAKRSKISAQRWEDARQGLANIQKPWLLVLDNADDPKVDYERYFPSGTPGVVVLTSRNVECRQHSTEHLALECVAGGRSCTLRRYGALMGYKDWVLFYRKCY